MVLELNPINISEHIIEALAGNTLRVRYSWALTNDDVTLRCLAARYYQKEYESLTFDDLNQFKDEILRIEYRFNKDSFEYVAINNDREVAIEEEYTKTDWEYLMIYLIELGLIIKNGEILEED